MTRMLSDVYDIEPPVSLDLLVESFGLPAEPDRYMNKRSALVHLLDGIPRRFIAGIDPEIKTVDRIYVWREISDLDANIPSSWMAL